MRLVIVHTQWCYGGRLAFALDGIMYTLDSSKWDYIFQYLLALRGHSKSTDFGNH